MAVHGGGFIIVQQITVALKHYFYGSYMILYLVWAHANVVLCHFYKVYTICDDTCNSCCTFLQYPKVMRIKCISLFQICYHDNIVGNFQNFIELQLRPLEEIFCGSKFRVRALVRPCTSTVSYLVLKHTLTNMQGATFVILIFTAANLSARTTNFCTIQKFPSKQCLL